MIKGTASTNIVVKMDIRFSMMNSLKSQLNVALARDWVKRNLPKYKNTNMPTICSKEKDLSPNTSIGKFQVRSITGLVINKMNSAFMIVCD